MSTGTSKGDKSLTIPSDYILERCNFSNFTPRPPSVSMFALHTKRVHIPTSPHTNNDR